MAKKVLLKDENSVEILPITRGELILDSSGKQALHSDEFLATTSQPGLMSTEDKIKIDNMQASSLANALTLKINNGSTEGTDLYTYDGAVAKTLQLIAGSNISFTTSSGVLNIAATVPTKVSDLEDDVVVGKYLPLSGGTLTNSGGFLKINRTDGNPVVWYQYDGTSLGYIGFNTDAEAVVMSKNDNILHKLIHAGNIGSQSVASATKLTTPVSIWGQEFDGTGNITGDLTCVGKITANDIVASSILGVNKVNGKYSFLVVPSNDKTYIEAGNIVEMSNNGNIIISGINAVNLKSLQILSDSVTSIGNITAPKFIGNLTGNADSATKLTTPRTIWGQSFDGSENITGDLSDVGKITASDNGFTTEIKNGNITITSTTTGGWAKGLYYKHNASDKPSMCVGGVVGDSAQISYFYYGGRYEIGEHTLTLFGSINGYKSIFNGDVTAPKFIGNIDGTYVNKLTGYTKATTISDITESDSLTAALGKLELKSETTYELVKGAYDGDGTIENLAEILKVLEGISDTDTIQAIVGKYLPLSGGTLTSSDVPLGISRVSNTAIYSTIKYVLNGTILGYLGFDYNGELIVSPNRTTNSAYYNILHSDNYSNYALPLSGGVMNADSYIAWNRDAGDSDVSDWNTIIGYGLRIISSTTSTSNAPTQYSTGLHIKGRYGFQIAAAGGDNATFYIRKTKSSFNEWYRIIHSGNISSQSVASAVTATTATKIGNSNIWVYPENSNEINFGGASTNKIIYIGYRGKDSREIPEQFIFGGSTGTANIKAAKFIGDLQGNATYATSAGVSSEIICTGAGDNVDRPIVVTNEANKLYYSSLVKLNYSTGNITAPKFTGNLIGNADSATKVATQITSAAEHYPLLFGSYATADAAMTNGLSSIYKNSTNKVYFIPSEGRLVAPKMSATSFIGNLTGNATSATTSEKTNVLNVTVISTENDISSIESEIHAYKGIGSGWTGKLTSMTMSGILAMGSPSRGWQLWAAREGYGDGLHFRVGNQAATGWATERIILDSKNFNTYSPKLDGTGATGTWAINISGSATKLATPITIWGQSFDGTGNVTGSMTGVGKIYANDNGYLTNISSGDIVVSIPTTTIGGWARGLTYKHLSNKDSFGNLAGILGDGANLTYFYYGGKYGIGNHAMRLYDASQNYMAVFTGNVTAPNFIGNLQGNADSATNADKLADLGSNRYYHSYGFITDEDDCAKLSIGSYAISDKKGGTNPVPTTYVSLSVLGDIYYSAQLCVKNDASRAYLRGITKGTTTTVSEWHQIAFIDNIPTKLSELTNDCNFLLESNFASTELSSNLTTITKTLTVTKDWMDTGISASDLETGTYAVQVYVDSSANGIWKCYWSGIMTWYKASTDASDTDEIILHRSGHHYDRTIYLRTVMQVKSYLKLQIAASKAISSTTYTFKFKKLI